MYKLVLASALLALSACPGTGAKTTDPATGAKQEPAAKQAAAQKPQPAPTAAKKEPAVKSTKAEVVTIEGTAQRAKLGPMVQSDKGGVIYCLDIGEWPDAVVGKKVKITGTLSTTDRFKARVDKSGAVSQGTRGGDTTMHNTKWELVK